MRSAIITGANRGIGKQLVKSFAENGYDIWACTRQKNEQFDSDILFALILKTKFIIAKII